MKYPDMLLSMGKQLDLPTAEAEEFLRVGSKKHRKKAFSQGMLIYSCGKKTD